MTGHAASKLPYRSATVIDAETGERLEGVPTPILYAKSLEHGECHARRLADETAVWWLFVSSAPHDLAWHAERGHHVRRVRVVVMS